MTGVMYIEETEITEDSNLFRTSVTHPSPGSMIDNGAEKNGKHSGLRCRNVYFFFNSLQAVPCGYIMPL